MKWNKFTVKTTTQATDLISGVLVENGIDGVEIEDNIPLSEEDKKKIDDIIDKTKRTRKLRTI